MERVEAMAVDMERALLGCTAHCSGILVTWHRCLTECGPEEREAIGKRLLERSKARSEKATGHGTIARERLIGPFIEALFKP